MTSGNREDDGVLSMYSKREKEYTVLGVILRYDTPVPYTDKITTDIGLRIVSWTF